MFYCLMVISCGNNVVSLESDVNYCKIKTSDFNKIIGMNIEDVKFNNCFLKDTILSSEGVSWKTKLLFKNIKSIKKIAIFESNYFDSTIVSRIKIINKSDELVDDLLIGHIGMDFSDLKKMVNNKRLNEAPDGYLILYNSKYSNILYEFDLPKDSELGFGIFSVDEIPDTLKLKSITFLPNSSK